MEKSLRYYQVGVGGKYTDSMYNMHPFCFSPNCISICVHLCKYIEKCHIKLLIDPSGRGIVFPFLFYTLNTQFAFLYSKCISWIIVFVLFCFLTTHYSHVNSVTFPWFPLPFPGWFKSLLYFSPHSHVYYYLVNNCKHTSSPTRWVPCFIHLWIPHTQHNVWHIVDSHYLNE